MTSSSAPASPRVAVIGAGLAGLAAAARLRASGHAVVVYDPAPGGKSKTVEPEPGWRIEWGPHSFTARADAVFALAESLGVADRIVKLGEAASARYLVRDGRLRKAPLRAFTLAEWVALVRGLWRRVPEVPEENVHAWFSRRFGAALADGPIDAMMTGIWASDPRAIEMDTAFPTITRLVREHGTVYAALRALPRGPRPAGTYGFPGGMSELVDAALDRLDVRRVAVTRLQRGVGADPWAIVTAAATDPFDRVVIATEAPAAARLLADLAPDAAAPLAEIRYAPLAVAHWLSPDAALPRGFGWLAAHGEGRPVLGTIFVSDLYPDRAPPGRRSFATMIGGGRHPEDARVDSQEARRRVEAEHRALTGRTVTFDGFHVVHHPWAVAPPAPGHAARITRIRAALPPAVTLAGSWLGAGAMDDAIRSGFEAADVC